jgi:hypothetical protein
MPAVNPYIAIIVVSVIVIFSYLFSQFSQKTNVPSVLLLIMLGAGLKQGAAALEFPLGDSLGLPLELLGIVGLTMIVLEAALDLHLERSKLRLILVSLLMGLVGLLSTSGGIALLVMYVFEADFFTSLVCSVPFGIMSSAIIIPSIGKLLPHKREFLIYESTFSDILGIMLFYFLLGNKNAEGTGDVAVNVSGNMLATVVLSLVAGYVLVMLLPRLRGGVKLFLLIATLMMLYAVGKLWHLSSLLMILTFGLMLNNHHLFFRGRMSKWVDGVRLKHLQEDFHTITLESAFVVRTFFFVVFGMTIDFGALADLRMALMGLGILGIIYAMRLLGLLALARKQLFPGALIAPRGLITILLSFDIPWFLEIPGFDAGIMLYVILGSSIAMTFALLGNKEDGVQQLAFDDWDQLGQRVKALRRKAGLAEAEESK